MTELKQEVYVPIEGADEQPLDQMRESAVVMFTEVTRKIDDDTYAVIHFTIRDTDDLRSQKRLDWHLGVFQNKGFAHADAPKKMQYPPRGSGGSGGQRKQRVDIPEDGRFQVEGFTLFEYNNGKQLRVMGVKGEEVVDWGGKKTDALMKTLDPKAAQFLTGWADNFKKDEVVKVPWSTHKLIAVCEKSGKLDKNGKPYWNIQRFEVE